MFSAQQQRDVAQRLCTFLSLHTHLSDSYIIEFFSEDLWSTLPSSWQQVLQHLSYPQVADLLLDASADRRYPSVWPLSLLAFCSAAHGLAFTRTCSLERPEEFLQNQNQSCLLDHVFRKHVKPKKQHEIGRLGARVKQLCDQTGCSRVVDVGSGQGHLTRYLSYGLGLSVTGVEADHALVAMASKFDNELVLALEKEKQKKNCCFQLPASHSSPRHVAAWINPKASWEAFIRQLSPAGFVRLSPSGPCRKRPRASGHHIGSSQGSEDPESCSSDSEMRSKPQLSRRQSEEPCEEAPCLPGVCGESRSSRVGSDFVLTGLHACGDLSSTLLRHFISSTHVRGITSVACCYMKITTEESPAPPGLVEPPAPPPLTPPPPGPERPPPAPFGYPMSSWVRGLQGHQLSYKAREGACHAVEDYVRRLRGDSPLLRTHCYRAMLEVFIRETRPDLRRAGVQTIKKAHLLPFTEYARLGLARLGLPPGLVLDTGRVEAMLQQQGRVVVYFSLVLLLAPVVETLVLLDRIIYLQENGVDSQLLPLFDPNISPRNFVLVALKTRGQKQE